MTRYYARSASDNTDDWPFWYVADGQKSGLNVTTEICDAFAVNRRPGTVFGEPWEMVKLAMRANRELTK